MSKKNHGRHLKIGRFTAPIRTYYVRKILH